MEKDPAFLFYAKDFYEGTRTMLPKERACYIDLMIYQHQHGVIPNDIERLMMYCGGIDEATLKATLKAKFKQTDEGWFNAKLKKVIDERKEFSSKQSDNGLVGQFFKKAKATLSQSQYNKLRGYIDNIYTKQKLIESLKEKEATHEALLKALLKHLAIVNEDAILNEDEDYNNNVEDGDVATTDDEPQEEYVRKKTGLRPTLSEVVEYFMSNGYRQDVAERAFEYYEAGTSPSHAYWRDSRGNQVKNWKQKMRGVWFKDENKAIDDSVPVVPDGKKYVGIKEAYDIIRGNYSVLLQDRINDGTDKEFVRKMMNNNPSFESFGDGWVYNRR